MNRFLKSICSVAALLLLALQASCQTTPTNAPVTLRVMTYNIHHGEGLDGKVDLLRIAQLIKEQGAELVALQEVDKGTERTQRRDFPAELAELTGMTCIFSNNYSFQGGEYGNAVLTKYPVKRWTNLHLKRVDEAEPRGLLQLTLDVKGRELIFMGTHLDQRPNDAARWESVGEIESVAQKYAGRPIIMCGDFNNVPDGRVCQRLSKSFDDTWALVGKGNGYTSPAEKPRRRIDYIWLSKDKSLTPVKAWIPESKASDHLPLVAEIQFK